MVNIAGELELKQNKNKIRNQKFKYASLLTKLKNGKGKAEG